MRVVGVGRISRGGSAIVLVAAACLTVAGFASPSQPAAQLAGPRAAAHSAARGFAPAIGVAPRFRRAGLRSGSSDVQFACQDASYGANVCYGPAQLRAAYGITPLLGRGITGAGRTIVIVDAFAPPGVANDLRIFDETFGLAGADLQIVAPQGAVWDPADPDQAFWSGEIALDVQLAHTVAPGAKLVLVEARSDLEDDVLAAVRYAVNHRLGDVISMSFGEDERCIGSTLSGFHASLASATAAGITAVAASGDSGAAQYVCDDTSNNMRKGVWYPAADPLTLGVGGTELTANPVTGTYRSEQAWNDKVGYPLSTGGGYSTLFSKPAYQAGAVAGRARGVPDVAYSAATKGAALIYWSQGGTDLPPDFYIFTGTSLGTPQWAGLVALAEQPSQHRLGQVNATLYAAAGGANGRPLFHDIKTGNNSVVFTDDNGTLKTLHGYSATPGWDATTGLGSPVANALVPVLAGN
jgi:subtilase family serine protease